MVTYTFFFFFCDQPINPRSSIHQIPPVMEIVVMAWGQATSTTTTILPPDTDTTLLVRAWLRKSSCTRSPRDGGSGDRAGVSNWPEKALVVFWGGGLGVFSRTTAKSLLWGGFPFPFPSLSPFFPLPFPFPIHIGYPS